MISRISEIILDAAEIQDSRGRPTIQVTARIGEHVGTGDVPAGASKGEDEARTVETKQALKNIREQIVPILSASRGDLRRHKDLLALEKEIIEAAGDNYAILGANAVLPVSRALWQLAAANRRRSLAAYIREYEADLASNNNTLFLMNIFNGGLHALRDGEELGKDRIDIQEVMIVPVGAPTYREAMVMGERIDAALKQQLISQYGEENVGRADEAGFSVKGLGDSGKAIQHVMEAIERAGYVPGKDVKLALDVAAASFYNKETKSYRVQGHALDSDQMIAYLSAIVDAMPDMFLSVEDGLDENDWDAWPKHTAQMEERGVITIGDDLFVTQLPRLRRGVHSKAAHAILIKVNQNGSTSGTLDVMRFARDNGMRCVISHRSGETLDDSIADLAFATGAFGLKTGDPQPEEDFPDPKTWVRRAKYLRMSALQEDRV